MIYWFVLLAEKVNVCCYDDQSCSNRCTSVAGRSFFSRAFFLSFKQHVHHQPSSAEALRQDGRDANGTNSFKFNLS